ncbi:(4Fe-4S)-binding protein [Deinococcus navajonensis]|uniref:(4Fe-4S)-binding protein n=1 Tax=Deinococcus navajonensis TaxID=309884 RepID=A0ABV8XQI9_9DEIO
MTQSPLPPDAQADSLQRGKAYAGEGVTVYYDAPRCVHVANCVRGLPAVFRPGERPWIQAWNAAAEQIVAAVRSCPTGALHYALTGGPVEQPQVPTTVTAVTDGPLLLRGDLRLQTPAGELHEVRAALCRCGASSQKPFCDGTHAKIGWKSGGEAPAHLRGDDHPEPGQRADGARESTEQGPT